MFYQQQNIQYVQIKYIGQLGELDENAMFQHKFSIPIFRFQRIYDSFMKEFQLKKEIYHRKGSQYLGKNRW